MQRWLRQAGTVWNVWRDSRRATHELEIRRRARLASLVEFARAASPCETLDDVARERIAETFGCVVRSWYGAAEAESIAYDCGQGWMHLNADWVILEPVDEQYRPVPPGRESATVLLTNLANRVQPIIRYDLGDRIVFKQGRCSCGSPLPAIRIAGRLHDIPLFTSPDGARFKMMPVLLSTACVETPGVQRHQVVQTAPDRLVVRFEPRPRADREEVWGDLSTRLRGRLADQGLDFVDVVLDADPPRADPRSGKYRTFAVEMADSAEQPVPVGPCGGVLAE